MRKPATLPDRANVELHFTDDGRLWYAMGEQPKVWEAGMFDFLASSNVANAASVRMLGHASNAPLICRLWEEIMKHPRRAVFIATPAVCPFKEAKQRPRSVFTQMRKFRRAEASCGGWRHLSVADSISYRFRANEPPVRAGDDELYSPSSDEWDMHPAYPALSFVRGGDTGCQTWVLGRLLDPRWHIDPHDPDKKSKVQSFMRLHPNVFQSILANANANIANGPRHSPARRMLSAWAGDCWQKGISSLPSSATFLLDNTKGRGESDMWLRATQRFLRMLCAVWLDQLSPARIYRAPDHDNGPRRLQFGGRQLFVPEYFFKTKSEVERWEQHLTALGEARNA